MLVSSLDPPNAVNETTNVSLLNETSHVSSGSSLNVPSPNVARGEHEARLGRVASESVSSGSSSSSSSSIATVTEGASVGHWATREHQRCRPSMFVSVGTVRAGENTHLAAIELEHHSMADGPPSSAAVRRRLTRNAWVLPSP